MLTLSARGPPRKPVSGQQSAVSRQATGAGQGARYDPEGEESWMRIAGVLVAAMTVTL
ncbi:hypothetical protein OG558_09940 [Kribbella sp. NBC_01510]|uniref:hypothetical protein n=1 Tax=Kribbella sp. NBC_01510 TaxID=2903581 RepID=UPI00386BC6E6